MMSGTDKQVEARTEWNSRAIKSQEYLLLIVSLLLDSCKFAIDNAYFDVLDLVPGST